MLQPIPLELLGLSLLASVIALIGGLTFLYVKTLSNLLERFGVPFAAGTMIVTALMGLLPEAEHLLGNTGYAVFAIAFFSALVLEQILVQVHHHSHEHNHGGHKNVSTSVPLVIVGDTIHNFVDGIAIAATYLINPGLALLTTISTFLHEIPHEIADFSILRKAGWRRQKVVIVNVLSALMTVAGAVLVTQLNISDTLTGYLMAIAAGAFFYLGAIDFLPHAFHAHHSKQTRRSILLNIIPVLLGALVIAAAFQAVPHSHDDGEHSEIEVRSEEEIHLDVIDY